MQVRLKVLNGKSANRELKVPYDEFVVGRGEECHLRPKSDSISRRHCVLRVRDDKVTVEDLGSKNGTYVDDKKIEQETEVAAGSVLRIGKLEVELVIERSEPQPVNADAGSRTTLTEESWADDNDITKWLEESPSKKGRDGSDPETRQLRLDETERAALDTAAVSKTATPTTVDEPEGKSEGEDKGDKGKKKIGKLPPRPAAKGASSREAAADMLKRFFNRP
jgi:pSer/pThr/pTyr-binding forkhead associated (FHA) protein